MAGDKVLEFTDDNFEEQVLKAEGPVMVDFWAPWCGPCRAIAPVIDELAEENEGSAKIGKMNIDEAPKTPQKYGVEAIPTLLVFRNGEVFERMQGGQAKARLQDAIDAAKG